MIEVIHASGWVCVIVLLALGIWRSWQARLTLRTRVGAPYAVPCATVAQAVALLPRGARGSFAQMAHEVYLHALAIERLDAALGLGDAPALRTRRAELMEDQARLVQSVCEGVQRLLVDE